MFRRLHSTLLACGLLGLAPLLPAQSWYRDSMLAPMNATTFEKEQPRGALKLGPVLVDLSAEVAFDYSDNELLEPVGQDGSHLGATVTFDAVWRAAKVQQLKLTAELTRRETLSGPTKSRSYLTITPGSALRYTAYVKDIRLTPFLNLSRQEDPLLAATVNNTDYYKQATYDAGLQVDWPLNKTTLQGMVLRGLRTTSSDVLGRQETDRTAASLRAVHTFNPALDLGADYFVVRQDYRNGPAESSVTQNASLFTRWSLSRVLQLRAAIGMIKLDMTRSRLLDDATGESALFDEVELSHRLRPNLSYFLRYSETIGDGVSTNFIRIQDLTFGPSLMLSDKLVLRFEADWQRVRESTESGETGRRRSYRGKLEWSLPGNFFLHATYRIIHKTSNLPTRAYDQRYFELSLLKQF